MGDVADASQVWSGVDIPRRRVCIDCMAGLISLLQSQYPIQGSSEESYVLVLSRASAKWRKLIGEKELVGEWNRDWLAGYVRCQPPFIFMCGTIHERVFTAYAVMSCRSSGKQSPCPLFDFPSARDS